MLLMTAVTGAWADGVSIKFEANGHEKVVDNVTLPYTFRCNYDSEDGELDRIIKEFYGISSGCCYQNSPTSDNSNVTAFLDGDNQCITIKSAFEGTAKVTGVYYDYDRDDIYYELTISVLSSGTPAPAGYSVTMKEGTEDATSWQGKAGEGAYQALPLEGVAAGTAVTVKYNGTKKVKSVKAVKKAAPAATVTTAPTAKTGVKAGQNEAIVNAGTAEGGTMMYMVNATQPASTDGFSATVPTAEGLTAGTYYVWYYVKADDSHTDSEISATGIEVTIEAAAPATITVTWNNDDITGSGNSFTKDGVTITAGDIVTG